MATALKRAVAGDRVGGLTDALSLDLLLDEEDCRQNMEALFVGAVPRVAQLLTEALSGSKDIDKVAALIGERADLIVEGTVTVFRGLLDVAVGKGLESIREELQVCEQTLGPKYAGLAVDACDRVDDAQDSLLTLGAMQYRANASTVLGWFVQQLALEIRVSMSLEEGPALLVSRLVAPSSVRVEQHSGRGLWWKVLEHCNRITREVEFATVNAARTEAMMQFNRLGEERG